MPVRPHGKKFQARIIDKRLPKGKHFKTFQREADAEHYEKEVIASLNRGVVPAFILDEGVPANAGQTYVKSGMLSDLVTAYREHNASISATDRDLCQILMHYITKTKIQDVTYPWLESFAKFLRVDENLAPNSIRGRVGCLGRAWRWYHAANEIDAPDPWGKLPEGYSIVTSKKEIEQILANGGEIKDGAPRNRRLAPGEYEAIIEVLDGQRVKDDVTQPLIANPEMRVLFILIANTGMRLREAYRLRVSSFVDAEGVPRGMALVQTTKGHRGKAPIREVPILRIVLDELNPWIESLGEGADLLFPGIWDGSDVEENLRKTSNSIARKFKNVFKQAGAMDLNEHDLRHEATCRWFTLKNPDGPGWFFNQWEIMNLMGWTSDAMISRYLSLRGSSASRAARAGL